MPNKGFHIISIKPITIEKLQKITDQMYPGMFIPSTLIMMMNEIKNKNYVIFPHRQNLDLPGRYISLTIRSDVYEWLKKNFEIFAGEYEKKYQIKRFTKFVNYFILNIVDSKVCSQSMFINLNESNFNLFQTEYKKQKKNLQKLTFEEFVNIRIRDLFANIEKNLEWCHCIN